jgi:uncharacterized protein (DUF305 family)
MKGSFRRILAAGPLLGLALSACSSATQPAANPAPVPSAETPAEANRAGLPHSEADVRFMSGMIHHHAQALVMARWVPTHEASDPLRRMAERIDVGQRDEIALMQRWLRERGEPVPDPEAAHDHAMPGMDHSAQMPGMLTPEQMTQLDLARGPEFDRLFLKFMIQHHQGALTMVDQLFGSQGAGQDETVFRMASDIYADQSTEIDRMQKMLLALTSGGSTR